MVSFVLRRLTSPLATYTQLLHTTIPHICQDPHPTSTTDLNTALPTTIMTTPQISEPSTASEDEIRALVSSFEQYDFGSDQEFRVCPLIYSSADVRRVFQPSSSRPKAKARRQPTSTRRSQGPNGSTILARRGVISPSRRTSSTGVARRRASPCGGRVSRLLSVDWASGLERPLHRRRGRRRKGTTTVSL